MLNNVDQIRPDFEACDKPEFHSVTTISLGELIEGGFFDWEKPYMKWDYYDEEQKERFQTKFDNRYYYRDIAIIPPGQWVQQLIRRINEAMPKYKLLYDILKEHPNIFQNEDEYSKHRYISSEFPQTMLGDNQDYASSGRDTQYETIKMGDFFSKIKEFRDYQDADVLLLDDMEVMFSSLYTVNMNGV